MTNSITQADISFDRIFLDTKNPRFESLKNESDAIENLCASAQILPLIKDIVDHGINPLHKFVLIPDPNQPKKVAQKNYIVVDGNRRICALKLLTDPEKSPASIKRQVKEYSSKWKPFSIVPAVIFENGRDDIQIEIWLAREHNGQFEGRGHIDWNTEQKTRFFGNKRDQLTLKFFDYAERKKLISRDDKKNKFSIFQRFLANKKFRSGLGIIYDTKNLSFKDPEKKFEPIIKQFISDVIGGKSINTRSNKAEIEDYVKKISSQKLTKKSTGTVQAIKSADATNFSKTSAPKKPKPPKNPNSIIHNTEITDALEKLGNYKLQSIYHSLTTIELAHHTPLLSIGVWAFFETLTACAGRDDQTSFYSFLSGAKLASFGIELSRADKKALSQSIERIHSYGNTAKHHSTSANFNGTQLNEDMNLLTETILKCIEASMNSAEK